MRPHRLRVSAFGPFPGTVEVDLDALSGTGLFLLHGDTGAGKTTLLDAMGFALYGRVPGVRNDAKRLRSDHAAPETPTEVQLEATLGGRRMRITRSPEYERPKKSGTGTTTQKAKVLLEEQVGGVWTTLSTAHREAGDEILELVGMSAEQFFQVVLLPQGEFAQFLRADSAKRAELLEKLFGTGLYRSAEEWLVARRRTTSEAVAAARSQVALTAARVAQAAGVEPAEEVTVTWAEQLLAAAHAETCRADAVVSDLTVARDAARSASEQMRRLAAAQTRRRDLLAADAALVAREPAVTALRAEAAAARRAGEVAAVLEQVTARSTEAVTAAETRIAARRGLAAVGLAPDLDVASLESTAGTARERIGALDALRPLAAEIEREQLAVVAAQRETAAAVAARATCEERLALLPSRRIRLVASVEEARAAETRLPVLVASRATLQSAAVDAASLTAVVASLEQLREEVLLAREKAISLRDKAADVREARLEAIRFELASMLVDGDPCPVCGSLFHPDPSEVRGERVTRDDEDLARVAAEEAQREVEDLTARVAARESERAVLAARVAERTAASITAELAAVTAEVEALEAMAAQLAARERELTALDQEQASHEQERSALEVTIAEATRRAAEAEARVATARERLTEKLDGADDLDEAMQAAARIIEIAEEVLAAEAELARCESEREAAESAAAAAAVAAGFDSVAAAAAALRPLDWHRSTELELRAHDDARAATTAALADPELDVPLEPAADVTGTAGALQIADARLEEATAVGATAKARAAALASLVPALGALLAELGPVLDEARRVRSLADLCSGGGANTLRMTLSSFVLAARLEEVAAAASERLLRMTQGRYSLIHTDGTARGGARSGLGLLARDTWTGQDRETATLSGGETFLASLALALGLTDVVTAEAGGARIEALFVDEGFGTLDEDTLDEVMDVLDGLREGGRIVGLVSHVAELRQRIPAQVHVRKGRAGSTLALAGC